ncbi:MAG: DUF2950 family protein [Planctomycetota bacterium]
MNAKRKTLHIACAVGAVAVAAGAHFGLLRPYLKMRRIRRNESSAVASLRAYLGAQGTFHRIDRYGKGKLVYANPKDGVGFPDLYRLGGPLDEPDGTAMKLIDLAFARATAPETAKDGYWFVDIVGDEIDGPYDYTNACGLCAVPAVYGETGIRTFIVDLTGTVYPKDTHGAPVRIYPDILREAWVPACM